MRPADAPDRVYATLRERLAAGVWAPGEPIREARLARELGVSRTPVREAIRRLVATGLLEQPPNHAPRVRRFDPRELAELYELRAELEGYAAEEAARRATDDDLAAIRGAAAAFRPLAATSGRAEPAALFPELVRVELAFHDALHKAAHNGWLARVLRDLDLVSEVFARVGGLDAHGPSRNTIERSADRHEHLAQLIASGESAEARRFLAATLLETRDRMAGASENAAPDAEAREDVR